ncbi:c-type cytochrome [Dechloromonas sp. H13]|uniref:c-type cytochrome n=1 Tax=Dechloromonas sp. H13 TaxID=2570193 RepID=UPI0012925D47|nr:c-type cytochrome [Dechloromonas sp. H13]
MTKRFIAQSPLLAAALVCAVAHSSAALADGGNTAKVKRGALLVAAGDCVTCHTPFKMGANGPEKDMVRGLSGHPESLRLPPPPKLDNDWNGAGSATMTAFVGPWGTTYAANLTPDRETGIGAWKEKDFVQAMRTGKHVGVARPIMPPMPWQAIAALPDSDLRAIYAYLMAQPAVKNKVPEYAPPANATARAVGGKNPG